MDIGTIIGLVLGFLMIIGSIMAAGNLGAFIDLPSLLVVAGGATASIFVRFPMATVINTTKVVMKCFIVKSPQPNLTITEIIKLAETARKESILALEKVEIEDIFLGKGIRMAVDGKDPDTIKVIMRTELDFLEQRHLEGRSVLDGMGEASPAFGMIGTLIGLVIMLGNLNDPSAIGPAMAIALITTFYGSVMANLIFIPMSGKLKARSGEESLNMEIIIGGVLSILAGENPRVIKEKLESYLPPSMRLGDDESSE